MGDAFGPRGHGDATERAPDDPVCRAAVARAARAIREADALLICAGAGMSVDSGVPDFRGTEGFWRAYPALARARIDFERIANPLAFDADPLRAWGLYGHQLALYRRTTPHRGYAILKAWGERMGSGAFVFTSNVDSAFFKAGFDERQLCECHGSLARLQCAKRCSRNVWSSDRMAPVVDESVCRLTSPAPRCARCGAYARPNVLMFDDARWIDDHTDAQHTRMTVWLGHARRLVVVEIGAGDQVKTVRATAERIAAMHRAAFVRINPRLTDVPPGGISVPLDALDALTAIDDAITREAPWPDEPLDAVDDDRVRFDVARRFGRRFMA